MVSDAQGGNPSSLHLNFIFSEDFLRGEVCLLPAPGQRCLLALDGTGVCVCVCVYKHFKITLAQNYLLLFSHSVVSDSLQSHGVQHARLLCPSPSPIVCSNSCPLSQWCHPTISSSLVPFSCLRSCPASGSFLMSRLLASGGQSIGAAAAAKSLQSCPTLYDPIDGSPPGSPVPRIL